MTDHPPWHPSESLGLRGLTSQQQMDIATIQGQAALPTQRRSSTCTLYVCELDPSVDESILMNVFTNFGSIDSIHLCRDAITDKSLGYAYIQFKSDDTRTILDHTMINGKPCRLIWMKKDKDKANTTGNLFIKNLDPSITTKSLLDTFSLYGHITSCKIVTDERGRSKGYGFIRYDTTESAERAIDHINGMTLYDREIFVGHHIPKQERVQRMETHRFTNVYVKNLVSDITEQELQELFGGFGPIGSVWIQRDDQGHSRGFGFINYERPEDAERAVSQMHATEYIGKRLFVSRAQKRSERQEELKKHQQGVNLYVKHLADGVDDQVLKDVFAPFGVITSAKVMREEKTCQSKGFGFVCFHTPQEANKAVGEMNGATVMGKSIYVALAQKKEDRRERSAKRYPKQQHDLGEDGHATDANELFLDETMQQGDNSI
ncbi:hypothetical protein BC941DRAFT_432471 [Chlamydoabsidia padenii]|nr:hypothetical protein BC941DRAFT_432471 [Chlamydoabsidia padenii]